MKDLVTLAELASDPERIDSVAFGDVPALIGEAEALKARLWARLHAGATPVPAAVPSNAGPDRLLKVREAAERLGVKPRWMYDHAGDLPFTRKLTGGTLRFSEKGLARWQDSRR